MPDVIAHCNFGGIVNIYLKTYTTSYPWLNNNWHFNPASFQAMEFEAYSLASGPPLGFQAQLIDATTGYTRINAGDITGGVRDSSLNQYPPLCYLNDQICGWVIGLSAFILTPSLCSYYAPLGGGTRNYPLGLVPGVVLPSGHSNTGVAKPGGGINGLTVGGGIYTSGMIELAGHVYIWTPATRGISDKPFVDFGLDYPTDARYGGLIPYSGLNYIYTSDSTGGTTPYNAVATDFGSFARTIGILVQNPATSTLDINALFQTANNTGIAVATQLGWLGIYNDTQTFNGVTMLGYGILMAPDLSQYVILNFIPQDSTAAGWNGFGNNEAKIDRSGAIWLKQVNNPDILFLGEQLPPGTISYPSITPQTPPINLPTNPGLYR